MASEIHSPEADLNITGRQGRIAFAFAWLFIFVLYFPAARAGFVTDFTGWLDQVRNHTFLEDVNRTNFHGRSLYQLTQFVTYIFYQLFGVHEWLWHLLFVTLHAANAYLLFLLCGRLLHSSGIANWKPIAFTGILFFCASPYISEVIVWEPSFHFLQGLLLLLLVLIWAQQYVVTGRSKYAVWAGIIYFLSTFSLEIFYITPWLVLMLFFFYRFSPAFGKRQSGGLITLFFLPQLALFFIHLLIYRLVYGSWVAHIASNNVTAIQLESFGKPAKYIFHLLLLGRFTPQGVKQAVYSFFAGGTGIALFYVLISAVCLYIVVRFTRMSGKARVASLLFAWTCITLTILIPLWFPDILWVIYDRYTYFTDAFFYMLLAVLISFITMRYVRIGLIAVFTLVNLRFAVKMSRYWGKSARVVYSLLHRLPEDPGKITVLLNIPQSMNGVAMIGAEKESEFALMHDLLVPERKIRTTLYDGMAYNMQTPDDGAHARVINDSTVHITLNQWGTWWWFAGFGGSSYENKDYKINMIDAGHMYELILKQPADKYLLLYSAGGLWKPVDMSQKSYDQY